MHFSALILNETGKIDSAFTVSTYFESLFKKNLCFFFIRLVLSGWNSSGDLEENGERRRESHHPGQSRDEGRQPRPWWSPTTGEEKPSGAQWEPDWTAHTTQWSPAQTLGR